MEPPLPKEDIPPDNEGWLCPGCDCKIDCTDLLNELQGMKLSMHDSWEKVFPVKAGNLDPNSGHSTDDSEDDDYDPEKPRNDEEGDESSSGGSEYATASDKSDGGTNKDKQDVGLPSDDSEDYDFDPDAPELDMAKEDSPASDFTSDSEDLAATLVEKGPVVGKKLNLNDEMLESDTGEESGASSPITAKRHVSQLDYKKLHDEEYGGTSSGSSDDEEWTDTVVETRKRKQQQMDEPEVNVKRTRNGQNSARKNVSQCNDSPKSNSAGAKGQSSNPRRVLGKEEKQRLQDAFNTNHFPDHGTKESLAQELGITYQQVDKWFGNARWFFNHPSGRNINVSVKAAKSNPVSETTTAANDNGDQSAAKHESSSIPGKKLLESSKSNKKATTPPVKKSKNSSASKTPQGQSSSKSRTLSRRRQSGT